MWRIRPVFLASVVVMVAVASVLLWVGLLGEVPPAPTPEWVAYSFPSGFCEWIVVEDHDGDGVKELWVVPGVQENEAGVLRSGNTGEILLRVVREPRPYWSTAVNPGDVDGDGVDDLAVLSQCAFEGAGVERLEIFDGRQGTLLASRQFALGRTIHLPFSLADQNGDGTSGLAGWIAAADTHVLSCRRAIDGLELWRYAPSGSPSGLGALRIGDVDADGSADVLCAFYRSALSNSSGGEPPTEVAALSGRTGSVLWTREVPGDRHLQLLLDPRGDRDGDGLADVRVVTGPSVPTLSSATGELLDVAQYDGSASFGDVNGDGRIETIRGSRARQGWGPLEYEAVVFSVVGSGASLVEAVVGGTRPDMRWMFVEDVDGDGLREVAFFRNGVFFVVLGRRLIGR